MRRMDRPNFLNLASSGFLLLLQLETNKRLNTANAISRIVDALGAQIHLSVEASLFDYSYRLSLLPSAQAQSVADGPACSFSECSLT